MSWIDKILPPQIQQSDPANRKTVPEGLWVKCGGCDAVLYSSDIEANLSVCPKCSHHMRINARKRLDHLLDPKPRLEIGESVYPVDALKFKDSKKYPDRLKQASDASGESEALVVIAGKFKKRSKRNVPSFALLPPAVHACKKVCYRFCKWLKPTRC
jgi:acetyl-CoA carboxylase carboxyl transferase subunit beta